MPKKTFVLDTNVLIHDPDALFKFEENDLILPIYVVEEIDTFKREATERGRGSRHVCRLIDGLRSSGDLSKGVPLGDGLGRLTVLVPDFHDEPHIPADHYGAQDRAILRTALSLMRSAGDSQVILVTMDVNLRIRAAAHGLEAQNYENTRAKSDMSSSVVELSVDKRFIDDFFDYDRAVSDDPRLYDNASVVMRAAEAPSHSALARYSAKSGELRRLSVPREGVQGVKPKNAEQAFALDLLLDDSVSLVTLIGKAGTGKTLLAIAAGLERINSDAKYAKMLVSRPVVPMGRDIGFLPGDLDEKLNPWMQPIFDNLEFIYKRTGEPSAYRELLEAGIVQVEPLTYIRGRSLPQQYLIVDEAQNLTPHEIKTIITRAGEGSKVVLTGDPGQIDNPYVDATSNGLTVVADRFRGQRVAGHVVLTHGERSLLAELAADLLP